MEFSDRDSIVENRAGTGVRQHCGLQAGSVDAGLCVGAPLYSSGPLAVNGSGSAATSNTQKLSQLLGSAATDGTYNWQITYTGDSNGNPDIVGACGTEHFTITNS